MSKPSSARRVKSAQISRRRTSDVGRCSDSLDGSEFRSQTSSSDFYNFDFSDDFDYDGKFRKKIFAALIINICSING